MIKKFIFVFFLFIGFCINGQSINDYCKQTDAHKLIKGTNVYLIPPIKYSESQNFKGFQNSKDQTSMIMLIEIPGPFSKVSGGFNKETLLKQGMKLNNRKEIKISDYSGYLIDLEQEANGLTFLKTILIFGDENKTTLINGVYLKDSLNTGGKIKKSLLSIFVNDKLELNPRKELGYTLNEKGIDLNFVHIIGNGMLFNRDKKTPTQNQDKCSLITDKSFAKQIIENKKLFCISRLKKHPEDFQIIPNKGINEIEIDNLKGFELYANNSNNSEEKLYQVILFEEDGGYYIFIGTYLNENNKGINDIKSLIKTFKRN